MKSKLILLLAMLLLSMSLASAAYAFDDLKGVTGGEEIMELKERGIVSGVSSTKFMPEGKLSVAQGIALIVKGLNVNLDLVKFVKEPKASDYFTKVDNNAWYAQSFIIAAVNGFELPKDIDPNRPMTREEFAHYLMHAVHLTGEYAMIEIFIMIADEKQVNPEFMTHVQHALILKIAELDAKSNFYPDRAIIRAEAAVMLNRAIEYVEEMQAQANNQPTTDENVTFTSEKAGEGINRIVLSWGEQPNPGYRISIAGITFNEDMTAVVRYQLHYPDPDKIYIQVITEPKAVTYVSADYKIVLEPAGGGSTGNADPGALYAPNQPIEGPIDPAA